MKHLLSFLLLASLFLSGCNNKSQNGQLSTDLVTSPKSATQTSDKQAAITFEKEEHDFGSLLQGVLLCATDPLDVVAHLLLNLSRSGAGNVLEHFAGDVVGDG